jgi:hypothetical protein
VIDRLLRELEREIGRLPATAGRKIARRNGRKRVLGTLRKIRAEVDAQWPAIVERAGTKRLTPEGRRIRAQRNGLTMGSDSRVALFVRAGINPRRINNVLWVPRWADDILRRYPEKLAAAVKSRKLRAAILAELALLT